MVTFRTLDGHKYMNLVTFRKSGQAMSTPVWFADVGDRLYVVTIDGSGKVKRLRNNPKVQVAPSTSNGKPLGIAVDGTARVVAPEEKAAGLAALRAKYGLLFQMFALLWRFQRATEVIVEITPAEEIGGRG